MRTVVVLLLLVTAACQRTVTETESLSLLDAQVTPAAGENGWRYGSRLVVRQARREGEDGSRWVGARQLFDKRYRTVCEPGEYGDGTTRCIPVTFVSRRDWYADEQCTVVLAADPRGQTCGEPPRFALLAEPPDGCFETRHRAYRLRGPHDGPAYRVVGNSCVPTVATADVALFGFGTEILDLVKMGEPSFAELVE